MRRPSCSVAQRNQDIVKKIKTLKSVCFRDSLNYYTIHALPALSRHWAWELQVCNSKSSALMSGSLSLRNQDLPSPVDLFVKRRAVLE